jgi:hypothetical protein
MWLIISFLGLIALLACYELPKYIKQKKSENAPILKEKAVYQRITNVTANAAGPMSKSAGPFVQKIDNPPIVWFKLSNSGKTVSFDCYQHLAVKLPDEGTEGELEYKGKLFRSFEWDGGKIIMDENDDTPQSVFLKS